MSDLNPKAQYKEGIDRTLDRKLQEYRKIRVWQGKGVHYALTDNQVDVLAELWGKERQTPWKMTFEDPKFAFISSSFHHFIIISFTMKAGTLCRHTRGWRLVPTGCPHSFSKSIEKLSFFYSKRAPSPAKTEVLHKKNVFFYSKIPPSLAKN